MDDVRRPIQWSAGTVTFAALAAVAAAFLYWAQSTSPAPPQRVYAIAFSPDSNLLVAGSTMGRILIWSTSDWATLGILGESPGRLNALAVSPDSTTLAAAGDALALWDLNRLTRQIVPETSGQIYGTVKYSPDGTRIATVSSRERIEVWDVRSQQRIRELCCSALYGDVAFDPKAETLASSGHILRFWDLATGAEIVRLQNNEYVVGQIAFSPDGKTLAAGSQDRRLRLWDVAGRKQPRVFPGHDAYVESVAFSSDSALVASRGRGNLVRVWNVVTGQPIDIPAHRSTGDVRFSPDGKWLAAAAEDSVWLWNLVRKTGQKLAFE